MLSEETVEGNKQLDCTVSLKDFSAKWGIFVSYCLGYF